MLPELLKQECWPKISKNMFLNVYYSLYAHVKHLKVVLNTVPSCSKMYLHFITNAYELPLN